MTFIASFLIFCAAMLIMAIGVLLGRDPLSARCGRGVDCCRDGVCGHSSARRRTEAER